MNKLITKIVGVALGLTMAVGVGVGFGVGSSKEAVPVKATTGYDTVYTLDTTASGVTTNSNSYASEGTVTVNSVGWSFTGNGQMQPWRLGGKSISNTNRPFYTTSAFSGGVDRIEVTFGTASSIIVNSFTVSVHDTASGASGGSSALETLTPTFVASSTVGIDLSTTRTGCYYRFVLNVTVSGSSNKFVQVSKVEFLQESKTLSSISASLTDSSATWYVGDTVTASDLTVTPHYSDGTDGTPITDGTGVTVTNGSLSNAGSNTVNVSYGGQSTTVSVTAQTARTMTGIALHGTIAKDEYYVGDSWDLAGLDIQVNWSTGDPTYVDLDDADVVYECTPDTATSTSVTEFDIEILYDEFDETFTVDGLTVSERPLADVLDSSTSGISTGIGSSTSAWGTETVVSDYTYSLDSSTGAQYTVRMMGPGSSSYLGRINNSTNGGIYTSTAPSGVRIKTISFSAITADKNVSVYVSNEAYTGWPSTSDYVATLTSENLSYTVEGDYSCFAIRGRSSSTDVGALTIEYESLAPTMEYTDGGTTAHLTVVNGSTNSITFEAENFESVTASLFSNNSGTYSSLGYTVSGTTVTVTATGTSVGNDVYTISATGSATTLTLNVTVQASTTFDSLVISTPTSATEFNEDDAFAVTDLVVTANYTVGGVAESVEYSAEEGNLNNLTYTVGGNVLSIGDALTNTGTLAVVISYTDTATGTTRSASSYNIVVNAYVAHTWTKVTAAPSDWRGTYLLVYEDGTDAYILDSTLTTLDVVANTVSGTISSDSITGSKTIDAVAVKIERNTVSGTSYYHAKCANGSYLKSANKSIGVQASATAANAVTFTDNALTIGDYILRFNATSGQMRFRFGESSYVQATCLYKMDVTSAITSETNSFGSGFMTNIGGACDASGAQDNITSSLWNAQKNAFNALSVDAQGLIACATGNESGSNYEQAVALYDYIVDKYGTDVHADFMNRVAAGTLVLSSRSPLISSLLSDGNNITAIIIIVSLVSVTAIGAYFFARKRKEQQ